MPSLDERTHRELAAAAAAAAALGLAGCSSDEVVGEAETLSLTDPAAFGIPSLGWAGIGLMAGLAIAAAACGIAFLVRRLRGKRDAEGQGQAAAEQQPEVPAADLAPASDPAVHQAPTSLVVEKLHDQGARDSQQDSFYVSAESAEDNLLVIVADGMGGLLDGDKVSQTAVMAAAQAFQIVDDPDPRRLLVQLLERANQSVNQVLGYQGLYQSGCTFAVGLARGGAFTYASVGDSRIYLVREGELVQLNREHVYQDELYVEFMNGTRPLADAETHPKKAGLTSFMGMGELKYVDLPAEPVSMRAGDRFLLMSDGVYNALPAPELLALVEGTQGEGATAAERLHAAIQAKAYSNQDNFTAVIVNCE